MGKAKLHDDRGPSTLPRLAACPGSANACDGLPDIPSKWAQGGTDLHALIADYLRSIPSDPKEYPAAAVDTMNTVIEKLSNIGISEHDHLAVEIKVDLKHLGIKGGGTPDLIIRRMDDLIEVVDFKFGHVPVAAAGNLQLLAYASGAARKTKKAVGVRLHIVQPALNRHDMVSVTADELAAADQEIIGIVQASRSPLAPLKAGDHCTYCRARATCPDVAKAQEITTAPVAGLVATLTAMPPAARAEWMAKLETVELWCETARLLVNGAIIGAGLEVPGYKVIPGGKGRSWADKDAAANELTAYCNEQGIDEGQLTTIITPAAAVKVLGKGASVLIDSLRGEPAAPSVRKI